jgi:hypothetical protein
MINKDHGDIALRYKFCQTLLALTLALSMPLAAMAQSLDQAARQAASRNNAKVLSARTVKNGDQRVHVIKVLTRDGVVKTVRVPVRERKAK